MVEDRTHAAVGRNRNMAEKFEGDNLYTRSCCTDRTREWLSLHRVWRPVMRCARLTVQQRNAVI